MKNVELVTHLSLRSVKSPQEVLEIAEAGLRLAVTPELCDHGGDTVVWVCAPCSEPCAEKQADALHWHGPATAREVYLQTGGPQRTHHVEAVQAVAQSLRKSGLDYLTVEPEVARAPSEICQRL